MDIDLLSDLVAIKMDPPETHRGVVFMPPTLRETPMTGTVVAVGPGKELGNGKNAPMECAVGDKVHWMSVWMGYEVELDGETYYIIHDDEILAIKEAA